MEVKINVGDRFVETVGGRSWIWEVRFVLKRETGDVLVLQDPSGRQTNLFRTELVMALERGAFWRRIPVSDEEQAHGS